MKVYNHSMHGNGTIFLQPGKEHPENSAWIVVGFDDAGREVRTAKMFQVRFENGMAVVDDSLGRYLIDKGMAHKTSIGSRLVAP